MSMLKKILALALALNMVMSLGVVAAFKDQVQIDIRCASAMELMNALSILKGDNNGNANPTKYITRAEAAAMIFRLMNKGKDDASIYNGMKFFTDVPAGIWYEGYVNYCYAMQIVQGRTATTFDPSAPVTGRETAKMLLICCGYQAERQGYTGANWAFNVQKDAFMAGMLENFGMALSVPAQRQWAAVMFNDAMNCNMVRYLLGEIDEQSITLGEKKFDVKVETGVVNAVGTSHFPGAVGLSQYTAVGRVNYKMVVDSTLLGQQVNVYYKDDLSASGRYDTVYAIVPTSSNIVATAKLCDTEASGAVYNADTTEFTIDSLTGLLASSPILVANNDTCGFTALAGADLFDMVATNSTATVKAIDNDADGKINVVIVTESQYGEIGIDGDVNLPVGTINDIDENVVSDTINYVNTVADEDFVKVTPNVFTGKYDVEALTAKVGMLITRNTTAGTYKLGSTSYQTVTGVNAAVITYLNTTARLGDQVMYYLDGTFIVKAAAYVENVTDVPTFVMLTAKGSMTDAYGNITRYIKALDLDGKITEYEFYHRDAAATDTAFDGISASNLYTVIKNDDGTVYLTAASAARLPSKNAWQPTKSLAEETKVVNGLLDGKKIASDLTVFTVDGSKYGVATVGSLTKYLSAYEGVVYSDTGKLPAIVAAKITLGATIPASDIAYALVTSVYDEYNPTTQKVEKKAEVFYAADGTAATLVYTTEGTDVITPTVGNIFSFTVTENVASFKIPAVGMVSTGELTVVDGNYLIIGGAIKVAAPNVVVVAKTSSATKATLADILVDGKTSTAYYLSDSTSGFVTFLYVVIA